MIPENYWRILRRWFWLIGAVALATMMFALVALPGVMGGGASGNSAATTLGVTRMVSFSGTVAVGGSGDGELLTSYTENIASRGNTPQFLSELNARLALQGVVMTDTALGRKIDFVPVPGLFRIDITAEAATPAEAEIMATTAAQLMVEKATQEEDLIIASLREASTQQQAELLNQLNVVYQSRIARLSALGQPALKEAMDNLVRSGVTGDLNADFATLVQDLARITADPELAVLNSQAESLERQLSSLSDSQRSLSDEILRGEPVSIVAPVDTVALSPDPSLRTRDIALMGLFAGLVLGWIAASLADGWRMGNRMERAKREEWDTTPASASAGMERFFSRD